VFQDDSSGLRRRRWKAKRTKRRLSLAATSDCRSYLASRSTYKSYFNYREDFSVDVNSETSSRKQKHLRRADGNVTHQGHQNSGKSRRKMNIRVKKEVEVSKISQSAKELISHSVDNERKQISTFDNNQLEYGIEPNTKNGDKHVDKRCTQLPNTSSITADLHGSSKQRDDDSHLKKRAPRENSISSSYDNNKEINSKSGCPQRDSSGDHQNETIKFDKQCPENEREDSGNIYESHALSLETIQKADDQMQDNSGIISERPTKQDNIRKNTDSIIEITQTSSKPKPLFIMPDHFLKESVHDQESGQLSLKPETSTSEKFPETLNDILRQSKGIAEDEKPPVVISASEILLQRR